MQSPPVFFRNHTLVNEFEHTLQPTHQPRLARCELPFGARAAEWRLIREEKSKLRNVGTQMPAEIAKFTVTALHAPCCTGTHLHDNRICNETRTSSVAPATPEHVRSGTPLFRRVIIDMHNLIHAHTRARLARRLRTHRAPAPGACPAALLRSAC